MAEETKAKPLPTPYVVDRDALAGGVLLKTADRVRYDSMEFFGTVGFAFVRSWDGIPPAGVLEATADFMARACNAFEPMREAILEAAAWMWNPDENANTQFERIAEEFHRATGYLRPGKDDCIPHGREYEAERNRVWESWRRQRSRDVMAKLRSALRAADGEE